MKQTIIMTILLSLLTLGAFAQAAEAQTATPADDTGVAERRRQSTSELRKLRLELVQQGLEFQHPLRIY
jgi:hypothetical protein